MGKIATGLFLMSLFLFQILPYLGISFLVSSTLRATQILLVPLAKILQPILNFPLRFVTLNMSWFYTKYFIMKFRRFIIRINNEDLYPES